MRNWAYVSHATRMSRRPIPLPFRCQPSFCRPKFRCRRAWPNRTKKFIYNDFLIVRGRFSRAEKTFSLPAGEDQRTSIWQIEKLAPAVRADVAGHDLARPRRAKQGASGAGEATLRPVLILGFGLRHLLPKRLRDVENGRDTGDNHPQQSPAQQVRRGV